MTNNYTQQAQEFLTKHQIGFKAILIGDDCPPFCEDAEKRRDMDKINTFPRQTHVHGKHYRCSFSKVSNTPTLHIDFWNSYNEEERNFLIRNHHGRLQLPVSLYDRHGLGKRYDRLTMGVKPSLPTAYDVLACVQKYDPGTFDDFCSEFGCSNDSRKAEETYRAVTKQWKEVREFFTDEELREAQEIN